MLIYSTTFTGNERYGDSPEGELREWSEGFEKEEIISVCKNVDGSITVFYWVN